MMWIFRTGVAGLVFAAMMGAGAHAGGKAAQFSVVELFTSQGCSSCPPADALLGRLSAREDLVALTFPVDYWDYLGWEDTLSHPANAKRQRAYAAYRGDREVYTPQVVINGVRHVVGSRQEQIENVIAATVKSRAGQYVPLTIDVSHDAISVGIGDAPPGLKEKKATLWLVLYQNQVKVPIRRGENHGKDITYFNVVREMTPVAMWSGKAIRVDLPKTDLMGQGYDGCALILQLGRGGPILGAARIETWLMSSNGPLH